MILINRQIFIALIIQLGLFNGLIAQISDAKLDNRLPILNGRAYFSFPTKAVNLERPTDIMSAGRNPNEETRVVFDIDKMRMVFFAQELYEVSDKRLFEEVLADSSYKANFTSKVFLQKDSMFTILSSPLRYDSSQSAVMVNSLLVQTSDSTVFRIDAYISPTAFSRLKEYTDLSVKVFQTLEKGERRNNLKPRDEKRLLMDTTKSFIFHLPANYCITEDKKYDFQVFKLHRFRSFTDSVWANMMVYVGDYPQFMYMDYGLDARTATNEPGRFLDSDVQWMVFQDNMLRFFLKEQVMPRDDISKGTKVHIAMLTNYMGLMKELEGIEETIRLSGN
jgi:hypothetical protein